MKQVGFEPEVRGLWRHRVVNQEVMGKGISESEMEELVPELGS